MVSLVVHMVLMLLLGLWTLPELVEDTTNVTTASFEKPQEMLTETVDDSLDIAAGAASASSVTTTAVISETGDNPTQMIEMSEAAIAQEFAKEFDSGDSFSIDIGIVDLGGSALTEDLGDEIVGTAGAMTAGSGEAVDRITEELRQLLWEQKVLVVWVFDQSASMKPDRDAIRQRIDRIYVELGLKESSGDELLSSVVSFGAAVRLHTTEPTKSSQEVMNAIAEVPIDTTGKEVMLNALTQSLTYHQKFLRYAIGSGRSSRGSRRKDPDADADITFASGGKGLIAQRKMVLILVTDESGDREENVAYLEDTIALAREAKARIYVLGRESVFSHRHDRLAIYVPALKRKVAVNVDRGPETAWYETIQSSMFGARNDHHRAGFGPYEQSRLARTTGGIMFMTPDEDNKEPLPPRQERMQVMRNYLPDLSSRAEYLAKVQSWPNRAAVWKVVNDLNIWEPETRKNTVLRWAFSIDTAILQKQARESVPKAAQAMIYYESALPIIERFRATRDKELNLRWRANYDLMLAELASFRARTYQYGKSMTIFAGRPPVSKDAKSNRFHVITIKKTIDDPTSDKYISEATQLLQYVIEKHPGTPWAKRAQYELNRGYGIDLREWYDPPNVDSKGNPVPIPKL